jgi:hypothetical protein
MIADATSLHSSKLQLPGNDLQRYVRRVAAVVQNGLRCLPAAARGLVPPVQIAVEPRKLWKKSPGVHDAQVKHVARGRRHRRRPAWHEWRRGDRQPECPLRGARHALDCGGWFAPPDETQTEAIGRRCHAAADRAEGRASARRLARRSAWLDHDGERLPLRGPCVLHRRPEGSTRRRTSFGRISAFVFRAISTEAGSGRAAMVQAFGRMSPRRIGRTETITALYPLQVAPARSAAGIRSGLATIAPSPSICRGSQSNLDRGYGNPSSS